MKNRTFIFIHWQWNMLSRIALDLQHMFEMMSLPCVIGWITNFYSVEIKCYWILNHSFLSVIIMRHNNIRFSQGSAATYFTCIGRSYTIFVCTSSENATVKEFKIGPHLRELWGIIMRARFFLRHSVFVANYSINLLPITIQYLKNPSFP